MIFQRLLSDAEVYELRAFRDEGWTRIRGNTDALALAYGVARMTIRGIGGRHNRPELPELGEEREE